MSEKKIIRCTTCNTKLRIPIGKHIKFNCPSCNRKFQINDKKKHTRRVSQIPRKQIINVFLILIILILLFKFFILKITSFFGINPFLVIVITSSIILYHIYLYYYFRSESFYKIKNSFSEYTEKSNDLNYYIENLKYSSTYIHKIDYGKSKMVDESKYNYKRDKWKLEDNSNNYTHHCSASVCKNANNDPIKYLCKYFNIPINENSLSKFEATLNKFSSVEQGKIILKNQKNILENNLSESIPPPIFLLSRNRILREIGFNSIDFSDIYIPNYIFQYVSAGGNSSSSCEIKLDISNLNILINYINERIKWTKSTAGQRALMTSKLREKIKNRDHYKCCNCNLGISNEKNLLLEIDHIIPVSKGGMTIESNLQTLCWKCNRAKGSKII